MSRLYGWKFLGPLGALFGLGGTWAREVTPKDRVAAATGTSDPGPGLLQDL